MTRFSNPQPPIQLRQQSSSSRQNSVEGDEYNDMNLLDADRSRIETALGIASFGTVSGITYSSTRMVSNGNSPIAEIGVLDANCVQASTTANGSGTVTVATGNANITNSGNNFGAGDVGKVIVTAGDQARLISSNSSATVDVTDTNYGSNENNVNWYFAEQIKSRKQFSHFPILPNVNPTYQWEAAHKSYVDSGILTAVPSQATNSGKFLTTNGTTTSWSFPAFGTSYDSGNQSISSGGQLILSHGLGVKPKAVRLYMVNLTGELGYTAGQEVDGQFVHDGNFAPWVAMVSDSSHITIRFSNSGSFGTFHATTGASTAITLTNWALVARAYL